MSTRTPSADHASSMARVTLTTSVPKRISGLVETAGDPDPQACAAHLGSQLRHGLGELRAVADEDQPDHGYVPGRAGGPSGASASAAARIRSHEEVAPGSWCPALRSPR